MRKLPFFRMLMVAAVLTGACARANVEQERNALLTLDREWSQSTKDADKFLSYYAADASTYPPGMPKTSGVENIRPVITQMMAMPGFSLQWTAETADVSAAGDMGHTTGTYEMSMQNGAGNPTTEKGKYITLWKKQSDGNWKVAADMFNSDAPPAPPSSPHVVVAASGLKWGDPPPVLPAGAKMAVVAGDPSKPEPFVVRLQMPAGYRIAPHWHPTDEYVTVLSGTFAAAMGDTFDQAALNDVTSGGYVTMPATMHHYATAKTAATVQLNGMGPFVITYVNPADDPSKK